MIRATAELKTAAERILALEIAGSPAGMVSERLRRVLSTLLGTAGFRALLTRAVTLGRAEAPELKAVVVQSDGSLAGLSRDETHGKVPNGEVVLVAHILGLLVTFVGEALTLRLVSDACPQAKLDDLDFHKK